MRRVKKSFVILFILVWMSCLSQVNATELKIDTNIDIIQTDTELKNSIKRSTYNALLSNESTLESSYNLKDDLQKNNISICVKNQKSSGSCWAFSFSSMLETSIAKQQNKVSKIYSPMHFEYVTSNMFNRTLGSGAGPRVSTAYCVSGNGPVEETEMPFEQLYDANTNTFKTVTDLSQKIAARVKEEKEFANIYKKSSNNTIEYFSDSDYTKAYTSSEMNAVRNLVKEHIKTYGAVSASIYMSESNYYNSDTAAYNYNNYANKQDSNHVVIIVGWDDNYSVDNFKEGKKTINNGAYIALNSYGTNWGKDGYMYISYEDACVEENLMGIKEVEEYEDNIKDYDKIYQHDELGMNMGIALGGGTVYAANKYCRETMIDKEEYIQEVGLYINSTSGVEIYINPDGDDIANAKLVAKPLEALETGYHTVKLAEPLKLTSDKFVIKVKYTNAEGAYIPMEVNYRDFGLENVSYLFDTATANDGECFISNDDSQWSDVNKTTIKAGGKQYSLVNSSTCIKAFTTYQAKASEEIAVTEIQLNKTQAAVYVDETETLVATVIPEDATNKNVTWTSSDNNIVTVEEGKITGKKEGTAIITVTTEDGNKTDTCTVTVQKKPIQEVTVTGIQLNKEKTTIAVNETELLTATVMPENATNKKVTWTSSDNNIVTVEEGKITGKKAGTATVTATTEDGNKTASCTVVVEAEKTPDIPQKSVERIELNETNLEVQKGDKFNLVVTFYPSDATNKNVTWKTSDEKIASVTETGIITAISEGKVTITAITEEGNKTASCIINVKAKTNTVDDIYKSDNNKKEDNTTSIKDIPYAGNNILIIMGITLLVIIIVMIFIRLRTLKEVK